MGLPPAPLGTLYASGVDTGHFRLYAAIQGLKNDHLPNKEFEPTNECFNAVYQI